MGYQGKKILENPELIHLLDLLLYLPQSTLALPIKTTNPSSLAFKIRSALKVISSEGEEGSYSKYLKLNKVFKIRIQGLYIIFERRLNAFEVLNPVEIPKEKEAPVEITHTLDDVSILSLIKAIRAYPNIKRHIFLNEIDESALDIIEAWATNSQFNIISTTPHLILEAKENG